MGARKIPRDTEYFEYMNYNPKGRHVGDCVARALAHGLRQTWSETIRDCTEVAIKKGTVFNDKKGYEEYLKQKGYTKMPQPRHEDGTKYTLREFQKEFNDGLYIVTVAKHMTIVEDGIIYDTWDCGEYSVNGYWKTR